MFDKEELHIEYSLAFENYIVSNHHTSFISFIHLNYFYQYPANLTDEWKEVFKVAEEYADNVLKNIQSISKEEAKKYRSIEEYTKSRKYIDDRFKKIPTMIQDLGEIIYQAKTAPRNIENLDKKIKYLDFEWYNHASRLVLTHSYFEAFVTKTIDIICKVKPEIIGHFLNKTIPHDLSIDREWNKYMKKLHSKVGSGKIDSRLDFLRNYCVLNAIISREREETLIFLEQIRHLIVHRNGIIDNRFLSNLDKTIFRDIYSEKNIDEKIELFIETIVDQRNVVWNFASELFTEVCVKFLEK